MNEEKTLEDVKKSNEPTVFKVGDGSYEVRALTSKPDLIIKGDGFTVRVSELSDKSVVCTVIPMMSGPVQVRCK